MFIPATPNICRTYLVWNSSGRTWNRTREKEKDRETERAPRSKARICSAIYHGLLFPIVGESRRIVDAREEGPRRISKTVSDRICIENAKRTRAVHPITGPINCGLSLFSRLAGPDLNSRFSDYRLYSFSGGFDRAPK